MQKINPFAVIVICGIGLFMLLIPFEIGCNRPDPPPAENVVQVVDRTIQPTIDSLRSENKRLKERVSGLEKNLQDATVEQKVAERKAGQTISKLKKALDQKDTAAIIDNSADVVLEFDAYKEATIRTDSIQEAVIDAQRTQIQNSYAEAELERSKSNLLKTAYEVQEVRANVAEAKVKKLERKLKRAKVVNKVLGIGAAAGVVLAGFVFL